MTDVGTGGAAAPAAGGDAGSAPLPALETLHEAASTRFAALQADRSHGARVLAKDAAAINERRTLLEILHGTGDDAAKAALAKSIALEPRATLVSATRAKAEAEAADANLRPDYGQFGRAVGPKILAETHAELSEWAKGLSLSPDTTKSLLQQIVNEGSVTRTDEQCVAWLEAQDRILLGTARGDRKQVDAWRAQASKALAGSKFTLANSVALNSAWSIRMLAIASENRGS